MAGVLRGVLSLCGQAGRSCCLVLALLVLAPGAQAQVGAREAVQRALGYMRDTTLTWKAGHNCASCHHAPMMLWTHNAARAKGYTVDLDAVATVRGWLTSEDNAARILPNPDGPADRNLFSLASTYTLLAQAAGPAEEVAWGSVARYRGNYVSRQEADGSYLINGPFTGTAPILESGSTGTLMAVLALAALPGLSESEAETARRARAWLDTASPKTEQELALTVYALRAEDTEAHAMELLSLQRPDGGWAQTAERDSDAYATGQALLALGALGLRTGEAPIADAVAFLCRTQAGDGSWPMSSRTRAPDGSGARNLEPITAAATAWAVLGLLAVE